MAVNRLPGSDTGSAERDRVDVRRYFAALRRNRWLIAAIVAALTGAVLALSLVLPKTYEAAATVGLVDTGTSIIGGESDPESVRRRLATLETILTSTEVLERSAAELGGGEDADSVENAISASVDPEANLIEVAASADTAERAAEITNTVADNFLVVQAELQVRGLRDAERGLEGELEQLQGDLAATEQIAAINEQLNSLRVQIGRAGKDLQTVEVASPPDEVASPRPLRNAVLALFASLFLGGLVALARDQLRPSISEPRELSRMFGRPVLSAVPYLSRRKSRSRQAVTAVEHEAYQNLRASVQLQMPPTEGEARVLLVTSAVHAEGKTTVTARLGRALAQAGHKTLLISADLRWPNLHSIFELPLTPGLTDVLALIERSGINDYVLPSTVHSIALPSAAHGPDSELHVLTSGSKPSDPARLLAGEAMRTLTDHATRLGYRYILIDAPPTLGIADVQGMAHLADRVVVVARLDRITIEHVLDMQELIERLGLNLLGLVVIGARVDVSPYYLTERPAILSGESERARSES